jgi:hypothetical protein
MLQKSRSHVSNVMYQMRDMNTFHTEDLQVLSPIGISRPGVKLRVLNIFVSAVPDVVFLISCGLVRG